MAGTFEVKRPPSRNVEGDISSIPLLEKMITSMQTCGGNQVGVKTDIPDDEANKTVKKMSLVGPGAIKMIENVDASTKVIRSYWNLSEEQTYSSWPHGSSIFHYDYRLYGKLGWHLADSTSNDKKYPLDPEKPNPEYGGTAPDYDDGGWKAEKRPFYISVFTQLTRNHPWGGWAEFMQLPPRSEGWSTEAQKFANAQVYYDESRMIRRFTTFNTTPYLDPEKAPWESKSVAEYQWFECDKAEYDEKQKVDSKSYRTVGLGDTLRYEKKTIVHHQKFVRAQRLKGSADWDYRFYLPGIMIIKRVFGRDYFFQTADSEDNLVFNEQFEMIPDPMDNPTDIMNNALYSAMFNKDRIKEPVTTIREPTAPVPPVNPGTFTDPEPPNALPTWNGGLGQLRYSQPLPKPAADDPLYAVWNEAHTIWAANHGWWEDEMRFYHDRWLRDKAAHEKAVDEYTELKKDYDNEKTSYDSTVLKIREANATIQGFNGMTVDMSKLYLNWWNTMDAPDFPHAPKNGGTYLTWWGKPIQIGADEEWADMWMTVPDKVYYREASKESWDAYEKQIKQIESSGGGGKFMDLTTLSMVDPDFSDVVDHYFHGKKAKYFTEEQWAAMPQAERDTYVSEEEAKTIPNPVYPEPPKKTGHYRFKRKFLGRFRWFQEPINYFTGGTKPATWTPGETWWSGHYDLGYWYDFNYDNHEKETNHPRNVIFDEMVSWLPFDCTGGTLSWDFARDNRGNIISDDVTTWMCSNPQTLKPTVSIGYTNGSRYEHWIYPKLQFKQKFYRRVTTPEGSNYHDLYGWKQADWGLLEGWPPRMGWKPESGRFNPDTGQLWGASKPVERDVSISWTWNNSNNHYGGGSYNGLADEFWRAFVWHPDDDGVWRDFEVHITLSVNTEAKQTVAPPVGENLQEGETLVWDDTFGEYVHKFIEKPVGGLNPNVPNQKWVWEAPSWIKVPPDPPPPPPDP
jgi:hypothetical protein